MYYFLKEIVLGVPVKKKALEAYLWDGSARSKKEQR